MDMIIYREVSVVTYLSCDDKSDMVFVVIGDYHIRIHVCTSMYALHVKHIQLSVCIFSMEKIKIM